MIPTVFTVLGIWILTSIPVGMIVGKLLARSANATSITPEKVVSSATSFSNSKPDFSGVSAFISKRSL